MALRMSMLREWRLSQAVSIDAIHFQLVMLPMQKPLRFVCNLSWTTESVSKPSAVAMAFEDIG